MSEVVLAIDTSEPSSKTGGTVPAFCAPLCFLKINITDEGAKHPPPPHPVWVAPAEQPEGALDPLFCNPLVLVLQVTRAVKELNTPHRLILSGSPLQNNLRELPFL